MPERRAFLKAAAGMLTAGLLSTDAAALWKSGAIGDTVPGLPPWQPGVLEIHHLDTGRGNCSVVIGPDGTSMMIDAGDAHSAERTMAPARPSASRRAGEWIARYVQRQLDRTGSSGLDVAFMTHLHGDHVGEVVADSPRSAHGYRLTGIADVAETILPIAMIDRGWPDYRYPAAPTDPSALNYIALAKSAAQRGTKMQQATAGSTQQLALRHNAALYPGFRARVLSVNGEVWTGSGNEASALFPPLDGLEAAAMPTENMCSASMLIEYGAFRYYSGGDLTCDTDYGRFPWHDIESAVAHAAGPVSVATANHHGYFDACGPTAVRALQPRVWIVPTWHVSHPAMSVLANLFSKELYPGDRSVFATGVTAEAMLTNERFSRNLASSDGHVVVRVPAGGHEFSVHVINAEDEAGAMVKSFGPFAS